MYALFVEGVENKGVYMKKILKFVMEKFLGSTLMGILVLAGQFIIQPRIAEISFIKQEIWKQKLDVYSETIELLNQYFASRRWCGQGIPDDYTVTPLNADERKLLEKDMGSNLDIGQITCEKIIPKGIRYLRQQILIKKTN